MQIKRILAAVSVLSVASAIHQVQMEARQGGILSDLPGGQGGVTTGAVSITTTAQPPTTTTDKQTSTSDRASTTSISKASTTKPKTTAPPTSSTPKPTTLATKKNKTSVTVVVHTVTSNGHHSKVSSTVAASASASGSLTAADKNSSPSGLSSNQKKTVIGVVVGIGGAILLGAIGVVAWRLWGKKRRTAEDDYLMSDTTGHEKNSVDSTPFKSTLDQYHNPTGHSTNF